MEYNAIDLFSGCGGMTQGLVEAGFNVVAAVEIDKHAATTYRANFDKYGVTLFEEDIRTINVDEIEKLLCGKPLHLLAGCPPCQGFSSIRRKNKKKSVADERNALILEYLRFIEELQPISIMLENVPGLQNYTLFKTVVSKLKKLGYHPVYDVVDVASYGVPQRRKRLVMIGSLLGRIHIPSGNSPVITVRNIIGELESPIDTSDAAHKRYPKHTKAVQERIRLTPHNGGGRHDLPPEYTLHCHQNPEIGFNDIYGRLRWDDVSSTITGGCLNPSKGRFLHPEQNRCITAREAALLQTFPRSFIFPEEISNAAVALMIGNALPPLFCKEQCISISSKLDEVFMSDIYDKEKRSNIMSKVKNKNTAPEIFVRKLLTEIGYKYRLKTKALHCKPDIVFPGKKKVIFINGCFWHGHSCSRGHLPSTNREFWEEKIIKNKTRDIENYSELKIKGWDYLVIWGCEIKEKNKDALCDKLTKFLEKTMT